MGKTIRKQAIDRVHSMGQLDDFDFTRCGQVMSDERIDYLSENDKYRKLRKIKKVDRKHGFIETTDGAWKEQKICKINGRYEDEGSWTQKGKKYLKKLKHHTERHWKISNDN